jgi:single-strand DNA-binding protein
LCYLPNCCRLQTNAKRLYPFINRIGFGEELYFASTNQLFNSKFLAMETTINKVEIQGFLGRDAEERTFESGRSLITLNVATNESYKNAKGEWITNTTWHAVTHWRTKKDEALMESLKKGALISVVGKLNTRKYTDKQGQDRYITEVVAQKVELAQVEA